MKYQEECQEGEGSGERHYCDKKDLCKHSGGNSRVHWVYWESGGRGVGELEEEEDGYQQIL